MTGSGGWKGVAGMLASDLTGTFDVAVFDLDHDGDLDLVLGRCIGTFVWLNQTNECADLHYDYGRAVANSTGQSAQISSNGDASLSNNQLVIGVSGIPANTPGLFLYGTQRLWTPVPFGNGLRWIGGAIQRLSVQTADAGGNVTFVADFTTFPLSSLAPGDVRDFQFWFRDPAAGGALSNASDALEIVGCP